jgi:ribosomal protein S18 acetylase RimI-like enzyme
VGVLDLYLHHPEPGVAHVALLLFRESCQGLGYGKETTAALEDALARAGFAALRLSVGDENPEAKAFWQRIGFAEVGRLDRGVSVYEKRLTTLGA